MDPDMGVIDYVKEIGERIETPEGTVTASQLLEQFLFPADVQWSPIVKLSGGEKRRLFLLSILAGAPNVLLLDEPTNDLDIETLTILEDYLERFRGAVVAVSHDRYFLDKVARRIFAAEEDGRFTPYPGGYTDYLAIREERKRAEKRPEKPAAPKQERPTAPRKLKFSYKEQREFETIDGDIAALEEKIAANQREQEASGSDYVALQALQSRESELEAALEEKMERWVYLNDLAEQIARAGVVDGPLPAVADLQTALAIVHGQEQQDAVVLAAPADLPFFGDGEGEILDRVAVERPGDEDGHLAFRGRLVGIDLCRQRVDLGLRQHARLVDHAPRTQSRDALVRGLEIVRIEDVQVESGIQDEQHQAEQKDDETQVPKLVREHRFPEPEMSALAAHRFLLSFPRLSARYFRWFKKNPDRRLIVCPGEMNSNQNWTFGALTTASWPAGGSKYSRGSRFRPMNGRFPAKREPGNWRIDRLKVLTSWL